MYFYYIYIIQYPKNPYNKDDMARTVLMQIYGEIMIVNARNN